MREKIAKYIFIAGVFLMAIAARIDEKKTASLLTTFLNDLPMDIKINGIWYSNESETTQ